MGRKDKPAVSSVVEGVRAQTEQAAALAGIAGQELLSDARLNPATRGHADRLRDGRQVKALDAEDARELRALRVAEARAAEAERTLQAVALAKRASDPARSVLALHTGRKVFARLSTVASVVLAAGSAMGVEEVATKVFNAPAGSGYIAEVGLTGLSTVAITYRAHLAEHHGKLKPGSWQSRSLWALMTVPLLVSVSANLAKTNAIGAACAIGAAAFALLACVIADRSSAAMQDNAAKVSDDAADKLRRVAMGEDVVALDTDVANARVLEASPEDESEDLDGDAEAAREPVRRPDECDRPRTRTREDAADHTPDHTPAPEGLGDEGQDDGGRQEQPGETGPGETVPELVPDPVAEAARTGVDELAAWLAGQDPPEQGAVSSAPSPDATGPHGAAAEAGRDEHQDDAEATIRPGVGIEGDQAGRRDGRDDRRDGSADGPGRDGPERVLPAIEARRAVGASTRQRIAEYLAANPEATNAQIAAGLGLGRTTVKTHRRELRRMQQAQQAARRTAQGGDR
ncbi:winged helix-turn-helix domain-containing protein [Actinomadura coerulea]|uniref:winged helix-turn-helix domain-containing protein n=1 Tax=Actinomadura coerulea TaxID=46159 RepID=UPI0034194F23